MMSRLAELEARWLDPEIEVFGDYSECGGRRPVHSVRKGVRCLMKRSLCLRCARSTGGHPLGYCSWVAFDVPVVGAQLVTKKQSEPTASDLQLVVFCPEFEKE